MSSVNKSEKQREKKESDDSQNETESGCSLDFPKRLEFVFNKESAASKTPASHLHISNIGGGGALADLFSKPQVRIAAWQTKEGRAEADFTEPESMDSKQLLLHLFRQSLSREMYIHSKA